MAAIFALLGAVIVGVAVNLLTDVIRENAEESGKTLAETLADSFKHIPNRLKAGWNWLLTWRKETEKEAAEEAVEATSEKEELPPISPLPPGSRMGMRPNPCFVGREDELRGIAERLNTARTTAIGQVGAVTGLGGIGKTQLAVEYVHRYGSRLYPGGVFWLDMEDTEGIANEVAQCGGIDGMNLPGFDRMGQPDKVKTVQAIWREETPRLLVFDNVEKPEMAEKWIPTSGGARVLITSRCENWPETMGIDPLSLETLPPDESLKLLLKNREEAYDNQDEKAAAVRVCEMLGHLPLALDMARAYLGRYKSEISIVEYESELTAKPVLEHPALVNFVKDKSLTPTKHEQSVAFTFGMSYEKLDEDDETDALAMKLFHMVSHFAPTSISRELLGMTAGLDPEDTDDKRAQADAINRLASLGLIQKEEGGRLLMHRLLREFALEHLPSGTSVDKCADSFEGAIGYFANAENESGLPAKLAAELEHLRNAAHRADERGSENASDLFDALGWHQETVADYENSKKNHEKALQIGEKTLRPDDPKVATYCNNLGSVLRALGDLEGAKKNFERALEIYKKILGPDHPDVAASLNNLGSVLQDQGDLDGAKKNYERALEIDEKAYGPDHPEAAIDLNNLGLVLKDLGDLDGAKKNYERALEIWEKALGTSHPRVAGCLIGLGSVLQAQGDLEEAKKNFRRGLQIDEEAYGPGHPEVATDLGNLGMLLFEQDDSEGARRCWERALEIRRRFLGDEHPNTIQVRENLEYLDS